jgi:hypothetical protein
MTTGYDSGYANGQFYLKLANMSAVEYDSIPSESSANSPLNSNVRPEEQLEPGPGLLTPLIGL